jgi:hypothetical protein
MGRLGHCPHFASAIAGIVFAVAAVAGQSVSSVERLRPVDALPAHMCGQFRDPIGFAQTSTGQYLVLDRRAHTVYSVDAKRTKLSTLVKVGVDKGELLQPGALSLSADDTFAVSDAPIGFEQVQVFFDNGTRLAAFVRPGAVAPRLAVGPQILSGAGSLHFTGQTVLISAPESGSLVVELNLEGHVIGRIGALRATGHESDRHVHLGLNVGLPLRTRDGGLIFVFQTGVPLIRKYAADGRLEFERHIEGPDLDGYIQTLPTTWPVRKAASGEFPLIPPIVRTAAISPEGDLWVSLVPGLTYVYSAAGDRTRVVQFDATGPFSPTSLSFSRVTGTTRALVMPGCYSFAP